MLNVYSYKSPLNINLYRVGIFINFIHALREVGGMIITDNFNFVKLFILRSPDSIGNLHFDLFPLK